MLKRSKRSSSKYLWQTLYIVKQTFGQEIFWLHCVNCLCRFDNKTRPVCFVWVNRLLQLARHPDFCPPAGNACSKCSCVRLIEFVLCPGFFCYETSSVLTVLRLVEKNRGKQTHSQRAKVLNIAWVLLIIANIVFHIDSSTTLNHKVELKFLWTRIIFHWKPLNSWRVPHFLNLPTFFISVGKFWKH